MRCLPGLSRIAAGLLLPLVLLAGCAGPMVRPPAADAEAVFEARAAALARLESWDLRGRVAVKAGGEGGQMSLHWRRQAGRDVLDFSGPLGRRVFHLERDEQGAWARDAEGRRIEADNVEAVVFLLTGWQLPLNGLGYWVRGIPAPGEPARLTLDAFGRLQTLQQGGWSLRFLDYQQSGPYELPQRLFVSRTLDGATPAGSPSALELRIAIERFVPAP